MTKYISPLITSDDMNESAKRFDNFMYGIMLADMEKLSNMKYMIKQLYNIAVLLEKKSTIPQV